MKRPSRKKLIGLSLVVLALAGGLTVGAALVLSPRDDPRERVGRLIAGGNLRTAQVELRNLVRAHPSDAKAHLALAQIDMKLADPVAAQSEFEAARAAGASASVVVPLLGEALLAQGLNRETLEQVPPDGPTPAHVVRNLLLRSIAQLALRDFDAAAATLVAAQGTSPGSMEVALIGARVAAARGELTETQAKVAEVLARDPTQIDALLMQEQLEMAAGDSNKALQLADRAVRSAPWSAMARMRRANHLISIGQDDRAQDDVNAVLSVQPRFIEAVYLNALLLARRGKLDEAGQEMDRLSGVGPRLPQALYYQALLATRLGRLETATDLAARYYKLAPADIDGVKVLARAQIASGRPEAAISVLKRATNEGRSDAETLDLLGSAYAMTGEAPLALASLKEAVTMAPEDAGILARYGVAQLQSGQVGDASKALNRSLALMPEGAFIAEEALVVAALEEGELDRAKTELTKLKSRIGESELAGLVEGALCWRRGDLEGARVAFAAVSKRYPTSAGARTNLAVISAALGQWQESARLFADILSEKPAEERALTAYVRLLIRMGDLPKARAVLEKAHSADSKQLVITAMLADLRVLTQDAGGAIEMLQAGERTGGPLPPLLLATLARAQVAAGLSGEAKKSYRALLEANPSDVDALGQYVTLLLRTGDVESAKESLRAAAAAIPGNFGVLSNLVSLERATGGIERGLKLAEALRAEPVNLPAAALLKGDLLRHERYHSAAIAAYREEYDLTPTEILLVRLVGAEDAVGQVNEAEQHLRHWLKQQPGAPGVLQLLAQFDIRARRLQDAAVHLTAVLAARPKDAVALNNLAWVYHLQGDKRARSMAQAAYLVSPTPDAADTLGWIMVEAGDSKAALPLLQQSGAARPRDPQMQYHLAVALRNEGQRSAAAKVLAPVVEGEQSFEDRQAAGELMAELVRN